jgi:hypothetical protein
MTITVLSLVAQSDQSRSPRASNGPTSDAGQKALAFNPNWALLGYELGEKQDWTINEY